MDSVKSYGRNIRNDHTTRQLELGIRYGNFSFHFFDYFYDMIQSLTVTHRQLPKPTKQCSLLRNRTHMEVLTTVNFYCDGKISLKK